MNTKKTALTLAIGSAFAASLAAAPVAKAAENPFGMQALKSGYMLADADMTKDSKAKDGKCGGTKAQASKAKDGKCGDMSEKSKDNMKATDKKMPEGKCGEGKCGGKKTEKK